MKQKKSVTHCVPHGVLALAGARESGGEDASVLHEDGAHGLDGLVAASLALTLARARIEHAQHLVLAGGEDARAVVVPHGAVDHVGVRLELGEYLGVGHIPHEDLEVGAGAEQHELSGRVPADDADAPLVRHEVGDALGEVAREAAVGYLPHLDGAVFAGAGDQVVVVRTPGDVEHGRLVADDERHVAVHAARLLDGQHEEGAAAGRLGHDRYELGIDAAEGRVPARLGDANVVVAVLLLQRLAVHVTELGIAHHFHRHLWLAQNVSIVLLLYTMYY